MVQNIILYNEHISHNKHQKNISYSEIPIYQLSDQEVDFLNNIILNNTIDNEPKSLYFIPGTKLKREFVRNNLDSVKHVRDPEKADYIVYSIKDISTYSIHATTSSFDKTKEILNHKDYYNYNYVNTNMITYKHATSYKRFPLIFELIQKYPHKCIPTAHLYQYINSKNTIEVTPKFIDTVWDQIASSDNDISKIGVETLLSLDQYTYQDVIFFLLVMTYQHRQRNYNSDIITNFCLFKKTQWATCYNTIYNLRFLIDWFNSIQKYLTRHRVEIKNPDLIRYIHNKHIMSMGVTQETPFGRFKLQPILEEI